MNTALLFHGDLDGLYSAILFMNSNDVMINKAISVEYGIDHSTLKEQFDNFLIFDFAENPGGDRTTLWVDHHLRRGENGSEFKIIEVAPSCVNLLLRKGLVRKDLISEEDAQYIDIVDSADYKWSDAFTKEDMLFPELDKRLSKFVVLNQLLRKNRKHGMAEKLLAQTSTDIDLLLYFIENDRGPKTVKYNVYMDNKRKLFEKLAKEPDKYIKQFSNVPVLFTKEFTQEDWKGYDLNIFGYLLNTSPFLVIVFDMKPSINIQITRNLFFEGQRDSIYSILKDLVDVPRGHESILNFSYENYDKAIEGLDAMINKLAVHL